MAINHARYRESVLGAGNLRSTSKCSGETDHGLLYSILLYFTKRKCTLKVCFCQLFIATIKKRSFPKAPSFIVGEMWFAVGCGEIVAKGCYFKICFLNFFQVVWFLIPLKICLKNMHLHQTKAGKRTFYAVLSFHVAGAMVHYPKDLK